VVGTDFLGEVTHDPDRVAIIHDGRSVTFGEVAALADSVERAVGLHDVGRRVVGVPAGRSVDFVARMLGTWSAGAVPAILGDWPADRVRGALTATGAVAAFSSTSALTELESLSSGAPFDGDALRSASHILFTSGTTGTPKGIVVGRSAFEDASAAFFAEMHVDASDRVAFLSRPGHDPSLRELLAPWLTGATLVIPDQATAADPKLIGGWLKQHSVTVLQGSPAFLQLIAEASDGPIDCLRLVCSVGAQLTNAALVSIARLAPDATIANCYGASETPQVICAHKVPPGRAAVRPESVPIGSPLGHVEVKVVPTDAPAGEGILHVEAAACAIAYTDGTPLRVPDGDGRLWYDTGDIVRRLPDGTLRFVGRRDRQVQVNGTRVELDEIEGAALRVGGVAGSVAKLVEDGRGFGSVRLTVTPGPGATVDAEELKAMLRDHLDPAVVPASVEVRDAPAESGSDGSTTPMAAGGGPGDDRDALMELLQECAQSALGAGRIDPDDGFFDAGFTSMTLMRFVSEVALRLDVEISPVLVFRFPNLNALADHLSKEP